MWIWTITIISIFLELALIYNAIQACRENKAWQKIKPEYDECSAVEAKKLKEIPKKWHRVSRKQARNIVAQLCGNLHIPPVSLRLSCLRYKGCVWALGMYSNYQTNTIMPEIYMKGLFSFDISTLIHEVSHHYTEYALNSRGHHGLFLQGEEKVFDVFKQLLDNEIVK